MGGRVERVEEKGYICFYSPKWKTTFGVSARSQTSEVSHSHMDESDDIPLSWLHQAYHSIHQHSGSRSNSWCAAWHIFVANRSSSYAPLACYVLWNRRVGQKMPKRFGNTCSLNIERQPDGTNFPLGRIRRDLDSLCSSYLLGVNDEFVGNTCTLNHVQSSPCEWWK